MWSDYAENLIFMERKTVSDGMGGFIESWVEGAEFKGAINTSNTIETRIAEQQGVKSLYTVTIEKNVPLKYNDVVRRVSDNQYFRITSRPSDMTSPSATLPIIQLNAELFTLS